MININKNKLPKWKDKSTYEKVLLALQIIFSIAIVILALIQIFTNYIFLNIEPLLAGITFILLFLQFRKYEKFTSYFCLGLSIFIFAFGILNFIDL